MPLYIRDETVSALAEQAQAALGAATKTEAVRIALVRAIEEAAAGKDARLRVARAQALARAMGPTDPAFDPKAFSDEGWDD